MRYAMIERHGKIGTAVRDGDRLTCLMQDDADYPGDLDTLIARGALAEAGALILARGKPVRASDVRFLPPLSRSDKIICVGLNYIDHSAEAGFSQPEYPTLFSRYASSLIGDGAEIVLPPESAQLDYEGELAVVLGKGGRRIAEADALDHVLGYSVFNDASLRDYQFKSPQWMAGKNFDGTGAFGPCLVTADELPAGARGLMLETRVNGKTVQKANTSDMVFGVARLVADISAFMTLKAGDLIIAGTPAGVAMGLKPPVWMQDGDVVEVEIEQIGLLRNTVARERF